MDVLELPRPVINFLRTMAKESCRYALSWDIFGGPDSVTLTLTWKLIDDDPTSSSLLNETSSKPSTNHPPADEANVRTRSTVKSANPPSSSSPRRSRRDENHPTYSNENATVPAIFRSSRGKSLEGSSIQSTKPLSSHHQPVINLERNTPINHYQQQRPRKEIQKAISPPSDPVYGHLYDARSASVVKCATISSLSSSSPSPQPNNNPPALSTAHAHHPRSKLQSTTPTTPPTVRKPGRSSGNGSRPVISSNNSSNYTKLRRTNHIARHDEDDDDDDDDTLDPWVKRFECSLEQHNDHDDTTELSEGKDCSVATPLPDEGAHFDDSSLTPGKVKFKTKPDYF